jgi:hypothetical protein
MAQGRDTARHIRAGVRRPGAHTFAFFANVWLLVPPRSLKLCNRAMVDLQRSFPVSVLSSNLLSFLNIASGYMSHLIYISSIKYVSTTS